MLLRSFQELTLKQKGSTQNAVLGPPAEMSSGPMLPFNVALATPMEDGSDADGSDAWRATSREATAQDLLLGDGAKLEISQDPVTDLCENLGWSQQPSTVLLFMYFMFPPVPKCAPTI